jgi:hypothetical protein
MCPLLEDFVSLRTLTKYGPKSAPFAGLCLTADFYQMWSEHVPLVGGLCHAADFDQMWSKYVPLDGGLHFATEFDHIWINNVLIIKKGQYPKKRSLRINRRGTETTVSDYVAT